jgi:4-alpha-glucanotransferase
VGHHVRVPELTQELLDLAAAYGVVTEYDDWRGNHVHVSAETIVAVLAAMDVDASTPEAAARARREQVELRWRRMLPACVTVLGVVSAMFGHIGSTKPMGPKLDKQYCEYWPEDC